MKSISARKPHTASFQDVRVTLLSSRSHVAYECDRSTARCRLPMNLFNKLNVRLGWIVVIAVECDVSTTTKILCTAWPDNQRQLSDDSVVCDDLVQSSPWQAQTWRRTTGTVSLLSKLIAVGLTAAIRS